MKLILTTALAALIGLTFTCSAVMAQADDSSGSGDSSGAAAPAKKAKNSMAKNRFKGAVTAVDSSANTVSVQVSKSKPAETFAVTSETKFKGATSLSDIAVGDHISGTYKKDGATMTALTVTKKDASAAGGAAAPASGGGGE